MAMPLAAPGASIVVKSALRPVSDAPPADLSQPGRVTVVVKTTR
jgi:hypothetical protein